MLYRPYQTKPVQMWDIATVSLLATVVDANRIQPHNLSHKAEYVVVIIIADIL